MPEMKANGPRHQDQGVCYYRQMPETRTMCLERCLKSRQMFGEIKASVFQNLGSKGQGQYAYIMGQYT